MTVEDKLYDELDQWATVRYRMDEGMEHCFREYSDFDEIKDEEFHLKREKLVALMVEMEEYVQNRITEIGVDLIKLQDEQE